MNQTDASSEGKYEIRMSPENCTGCLRCQLGCSDFYTREFNQNTARIRIQSSELDCSITFTEDCRKCGECADHCLYGVLEKVLKEAEV